MVGSVAICLSRDQVHSCGIENMQLRRARTLCLYSYEHDLPAEIVCKYVQISWAIKTQGISSSCVGDTQNTDARSTSLRNPAFRLQSVKKPNTSIPGDGKSQ